MPNRSALPRTEPKSDKAEKAAKLDFSILSDELSGRPTTQREPTFSRPVTPPPGGRPAPTAPAPVAISPVAAPAAPPVEKPDKASAAAEPDHNLADMATSLNASMRREPRLEMPPPVGTEPAVVPPPTARMTRPEPPKAAPPNPPQAEKPPQPEKPKAAFDSLEEEMASLLGRPPGKP